MFRNEFFEKLYQSCKGKIEVRPLPGGRRGFFDIDDTVGIDIHCGKFTKSNLYFGVATRDGKAGGRNNIVDIPAVWTGIDYKTTPKEIAAEKLKQFSFKSSIAVESGGGVHLYWLLKEPAGKSDIATVEDVTGLQNTSRGPCSL